MRMQPGVEYQVDVFLDASALVKLVVAEEHSEKVRRFVDDVPPVYTTSICLVEALSVLKRKCFFQHSINRDEYFRAAFLLMQKAAEGGKIIVEDTSLHDSGVYFEVEALAIKHDLDLSDALQLFAIKSSAFDAALATADRRLADAARAESLPLWDLLREDHPSWCLDV